MGFKDYLTHSKVLLSRWVTRALEDPSTEWAVVFIAPSKAFTWEQRRTLNRALYNDTNRILFSIVKSYGSLIDTSSL